MPKWKVVKTVTEYHSYIIEADTEQEACTKADLEYPDPDCADHTVVEIESSELVEDESVHNESSS
jgi:hypothetical protein